jgi:WD40 repeat protein
MSSTTSTLFQSMSGHTSSTNGLTQINENQIASISNDNTMRVWDTSAGTLVNTYNGHTSSICSVVVLPGNLIATGSADKTIRLWNMETQTVTVTSLPSPVMYMILNPLMFANGALVASVVNYLYFLDPETLNQMQVVTTNRTYYGMDFLIPSGNVLCGFQNLDVYDTTGSLVFSYSYSDTTVYRMKLLSDNVTVAIGLFSGSIQLFNADTNTFGSTITAHTTVVGWIGLTPDNLFLLSGGHDNSVIVWTWSTMSLTRLNTFSSLASQINAMVIFLEPLTSIFSNFKQMFQHTLVPKRSERSLG